ncbi:MAG: hypothetical protein OEY14_13555, partial [Myxococcales bacterium]|nr:hypothetical protein [Myxococcales bacterium]
MQEEESKDGSISTRERSSMRAGRRIVLSIYWGAILYMAVVGFASVIPGVFWPPIPSSTVSPTPSAADDAIDCPDAISNLEREMLEGAGHHVARGGQDALPPYDRWEARLLALSARCPDHPSLNTLARLRYQLESSLERFAREEGELVQRLRAHVP